MGSRDLSPWNEMNWAAFFASGALLVNGIPHLVQGLCGNRFQSPFAKPPGVGESSPLVNVLWGFLNLLVSGILIGVSGLRFGINVGFALFAAGCLVSGAFLAVHFGKVRS